MAIQLPSHLHRNRHGVYGFRLVVPHALRVLCKTSECRLSLKTADTTKAKRLAAEMNHYVRRYFTKLTLMASKNPSESNFSFIDDLKAQRDRLTPEILNLAQRAGENDEAVEELKAHIEWLNEVRGTLDALDALDGLNDREKEQRAALRSAYDEEFATILPKFQALAENEEAINEDARRLRETALRISLTMQHDEAITEQANDFSSEKDKLAEFAASMVAKATARAVGEVLGAKASESIIETKSEPLGAIVEAYVANQRAEGAWTEKTEAENSAIYALWIRIVGDQPIKSYGFEQHREYKAKLQRLPSNLNKSPRYREKTIDEVISLGDAPAAPNTINKNLTRVSALFEWAIKYGYATLNPARGMTIANPKRANEERQAFTDDDLAKLFGSAEYIEGRHKHPYQYWVPLIALYSGARLNEICQLHLNDITEQDGVPVIRITDEDGNKRLKTKAARRIIPIHSDLIRLRLLSYVDNLKTHGHNRLFPELREGRDGYGRVVSKWFAAYASRCGVDAPGKVFHSFRHTFINRLKQADAPKEKIAALVGHEDESVTFGRYGKDFKPQNLREVILLIPNNASAHLKQN